MRKSAVTIVAALIAGGIIHAPASASPPPADEAPAASSGLLAVVFQGGADGITVLVGSEDGWTSAAQVVIPGVETSAWEGYGCANADQTHALIAFAPIEYANNAEALGFVATVDLGKPSAVHVLDMRVPLRYHTPGCGRGDDGVVSSYDDASDTTTLYRIDLATAETISTAKTPGQLTSVVPTSSTTVAAAAADTLIEVDTAGEVISVDPVGGQPTQLHPRSDGGVDALVVAVDDSVAVASKSADQVTVTTVSSRGEVGLFLGEKENILAGRIFDSPSSGLVSVEADSVPLAVDSTSGAYVASVDRDPAGVPAGVVEVDSDGVKTQRPISDIEQAPTEMPTTKDSVATSGVRTGGSFGRSRALPAKPADTSGTPTCVIGRNDRAHQVYQPTLNQVEWAADLAVQGALTVTRPADWGGHAMAAYQPQTLIPLPSLTGGGRIPAPILLGVLAQESNLKQAAKFAPRGMYGNSLVGDYYGYDWSTATVHFTDADCGYGIGQITDGMRAGSTVWTTAQQNAIAWDYAANIAAAAKMLADKWNQLAAAGMYAQSGNANNAASWYFVLWAYNTGFTPNPGTTAPWGVGWTNNPRQPDFDANRAPFLASRADAEHPSRWPYQERVIGWANYGFIESGNQAYARIADLITAAPKTKMCNADGHNNNCDPVNQVITPPSTLPSYCLSADRTACRWHWSTTWLENCNCEPAATTPSYSTIATEPTSGTPPYTPACSASLPTGTVIVDNIVVSKNRVGCPVVNNAGTFALAYGNGTSDPQAAQIELHQIGGSGYLGQFWFSHTYGDGSTRDDRLRITGTWTPPSGTTGWRKILVHVPALGAESPQADYSIYTSSVASPIHRILNQRYNANTWVELGTFNFSAGASVSLSNQTYYDWSEAVGRPDVDIAWDAIAFVPSTAPTKSYVALGDSYQAGEGIEPYLPTSDVGGAYEFFEDSCHRSSQAYPALIATAAAPSQFFFLACSGATVRDMAGDPSAPTTKYTRHTEMPQMFRGYLDSQTTAVSVGIGGNDVRFGDVVDSCTRSLDDCSGSTYVMGTDPSSLRTMEYGLIDELQNKLVAVYQGIKSRAPNATIVAVGYPRLFVANPAGGCNGLTPAEMTFLNELGDRMNSRIAAAAATAGILFYNPNTRYEGHRVCESGEAVNGLVAWSSSGSSAWNSYLSMYADVPGRGSYHPKASGQALIAADIRALLGL